MTSWGGGGASTLGELLDVTLTSPSDGQYLQLGASGQWNNVNLPDFVTSDELTAAIGDGTITIETSDGTEVGSFTVNQAGDATISLPADVAPADQDLQSVLDTGNTSTTGFTISDGDGSATVSGTGQVTATTDSSANTAVTALGYRSLDWNSGSGYTAFSALNYAVETFSVDTMGDVYIRRSLVIGNEGVGGDAVAGELNVLGGATVKFGTTGAQLGNVMPRDDWSSIPART